ncbi:hypothetical protein L3D22_04910 [Lysobacter soli]|uniref:hypothetical protein n=1 Tax=Lysobacter soli TaxID=453783 RepID=UPI0020A19D3A|nr:hypothetical protein [Lysobacter soli]UTA55177.1 hypothetical protein L3D22_04910 [Lysobacter soli]
MMEALSVPLYHGTSTLFLSGIREHGLGGDNPLTRWRVLEFAHRLWPLVATHLAREDDWMLQAQAFEWMCEQRSSNFNFQHGHAYLSPSEQTAVRYSVGTRYGSELLSYTLELLGELVRRNVVRESEFAEHAELFKLLRRSFAPILIEVSNVLPKSLLDECGGDPRRNLEQMTEIFATCELDLAQCMLQQTNFRLSKAVPLADLSFWLLDLGGCEHSLREVSKHLIYVHGSRNGGMEASSRAAA